MGQKRLRKERFLKEHPVCCFCGGNTPATTEDHVPARSIFDERKWPEGYVFPACDDCNQVTRYDEDIVGFLSRMRSTKEAEQTDIQRTEMRRCIAALKANHPEAHQSLRLSGNKVRRFFRETRLQRPVGVALNDIPLLNIDRPEFKNAISNFGVKLFCALHYFHTGDIVKSHWHVATRLLSNVQLEAGVLSEEMFKAMNGRAAIQRARNDLQDQFAYIYGVATERTTSAYLCGFRESFALIGLVSADQLPAAFAEDVGRGAFFREPFPAPGNPIAD